MRTPWLVYAGTIVLGAALAIQGCKKDSAGPVDVASTSTDPTEQWIEPGTPIEGQYIVVLKQSLGKVDAHQAALAVAAAYNIQTEYVYGAAIAGFAGKVPENQLDALKHDSRVSYIEQDRAVGLPPYKIEKGGPPQPSQPAETTPWGITRVGGGGTNNSNLVAWIIDTGIDYTHPDLNVDKTDSRNFVRLGRSADDDNGHGTHVAGIIAAINNDIGVIGVAPGATVVAVKVLNSAGSGTTSGVIAGVNYVAGAAKSGDVANMSLGGGISNALDQAVRTASETCPFTVAAGNSAAPANNYSPARAGDVSTVYTISAFAAGDKFASFSNYGPPIDYSEPGVSVLSTYKGDWYATMSGTSMAAPHAAGILLLGSIQNGGNVTGDLDGTSGTAEDIIGVVK